MLKRGRLAICVGFLTLLAAASPRHLPGTGNDWPGQQTLEATPLEVASTLYFTGSHAEVLAVDARSGKLKWTYDPET